MAIADILGKSTANYQKKAEDRFTEYLVLDYSSITFWMLFAVRAQRILFFQ